MKIINCSLFLFSILFLLITAGCGYHSPYYVKDDGSVDSKNIYLTMWNNQTSETGLESSMFRSLNKWFKQSKMINVTRDMEKADLILNGEIISLSLPGQSYNQYDRAQEVNTVLTVRYNLKEAQGKKTLINEQGLTLDESYLIEPEPAKTRTNRQKALTRITNDLAEKTYLRVLSVISSLPSAN